MLDRSWFRLGTAVLFVLIWCAPFYLDAATADSTSGSADVSSQAETAFFIVWIGLTLLVGYIVRSPSLLLPIVIYVALLPLGVNPEDSDGWTYAGLYLVPVGFFSFFILAFGWLGRLAADFWRKHRPLDGVEQ